MKQEYLRIESEKTLVKLDDMIKDTRSPVKKEIP